jgi:hypothetical protein
MIRSIFRPLAILTVVLATTLGGPAGELRECAWDIDGRLEAELRNEPPLPGEVMPEMDVLIIAATVTDDDVDEHAHDPLYRVPAAIDGIVSKRLRNKRIRTLPAK